MAQDVRDFWDRFQSAVEVAVGSSSADKLLGVRDGFVRYLQEGLNRSLPVVVVPAGSVEPSTLHIDDEDVLAEAWRTADALSGRSEPSCPFSVGVEVGLHTLEVEGRILQFVRCWAVVRCTVGEAAGGSGSLQLPTELTSASGSSRRAVPGTRRSGGMISSLTGGLETRRTSVAAATLNALSSLFFGIMESRPAHHGWHGRRFRL